MQNRQFPPAFEAYIAPARQTPELWRLFIGFCVMSSFFILGQVGFLIFVTIFTGVGTFQEILAGETPGHIIILTFSFLSLTLGCFAAVKLIHRRPIATLLSPGTGLNWRHFEIGLIVVGLITIAAFLLELILSPFSSTPVPEVVQNLPLTTWLMWIPLGLLTIFIQTSAEEIAFRGYLQQQLAARYSSAWVWAVLPSVFFALLHYDYATFGSNTYLVMASIGIGGWCVAHVTAYNGNLGAAIGLHFGNNLLAFCLIGLPGEMDGLSLLHVLDYDLAGAEMRLGLVINTGLMLAAFFLWRRYFTVKE